MEQWKDIVGCEGYYQVSNLGRVKGLSRKIPIKRYGKIYYRQVGEMILLPHTNTGYCTVTLGRGNKGRVIRKIHRLVAGTFLPNPEGKKYINHKDSNPKNNKVDNLEWCTPQENSTHCKNSGRSTFGNRNGRVKLTEKQVLEIRGKYRAGTSRKDRGCSQSMLADEYGVTKTLVRHILQRKLWKHI